MNFCEVCPRDRSEYWCVSRRNPTVCAHVRQEQAAGADGYFTAKARSEEPTDAELARLREEGEFPADRTPTAPLAPERPTGGNPAAPTVKDALDCLNRARRCRHRRASSCASALCTHPSRAADPFRSRVYLSDCRECVATDAGFAPAPTVSIVVAARNYGRYLAEALTSCFQQAVKPLEVIYCDDASGDNSLAIARSIPNVRVVPAPSHQGVCAARNRGLAAARGDYLVFLDGDDILPPTYLEDKIAALGDRAEAFVYGAAWTFGAREISWEAPEWDWPRLWAMNYVNSSTLFPRRALLELGGWREESGPFWDWDLAIRLARRIPAVRDPHGYLLYRQHSSSESHRALDLNSGSPDLLRLSRQFRMRAARVRIACVLSDRVLGRFGDWLSAVVRALRWADGQANQERPFPPLGRFNLTRPDLSILYTGEPGRRGQVLDQIAGHEADFGQLDFSSERWDPSDPDEHARRWNVARGLAERCNRLNDGPQEVTWFLEDDIEPPETAYWDLLAGLLGGSAPRPAVAGWYRNRHVPQKVLAGRVVAGQIEEFQDDIRQDIDVELVGTGCLMIFRPAAPHPFGADCLGVPAHDWNWSLKVPGGVRVLAGVRCRHYLSLTEYV